LLSEIKTARMRQIDSAKWQHSIIVGCIISISKHSVDKVNQPIR